MTLDKTTTQAMLNLATPSRKQEFAQTSDKYLYAKDTLVMALGNSLPLNLHVSNDLIESFEDVLSNQHQEATL